MKQEKLKKNGSSSKSIYHSYAWKAYTLERSRKLIEALNILIEDYNNSNFQAVVLGSDQGRKVYKRNL